jgi:adenylate kinase
MQLILLGPPGAGKGTQANNIATAYNLAKLSTGDMLRKIASSGSKLGMHIKTLMRSGNLIPDDTIISMVQVYMDHEHDNDGFLFDGFPRTLAQAQSLADAGIDITHVINIDVTDQVIIERLGGRMVHAASGRTYHIKHNPPKVAGIDDITGDALETRTDDSIDAINNRLNIFHIENDKIVNYYQQLSQQGSVKFTNLDGTLPIKQITTTIKRHLS